MQRRCWRWLWIWVGVLATGCGQIWSSNAPQSATREPTLPLLGYTLLPASLTPSLWPPAHTVTPWISLDGAGLPGFPLAVYLRVRGPACYETPVGSLICLGEVHNLLDRPVEQVVVVVQLLAQDGTPLATQESLVARWTIPAGAWGPYRVLFDSAPAGYVTAYPFVKSGEISSDPQRSMAVLGLEKVSGAFVLDQYQVTFSVTNTHTRAVQNIVITMTLLDQQGHVTGFRQVYLDSKHCLEAGESLSLTIKTIPQGPNTVGFEAFADGYFVW